MIEVFIKWIIYTLVIIFISWIIPGIEVDNFLSAMIVCLVLGLINTFIKPFLALITLPITFVTFGLFSLILNALMFMLAGWVTPGFEVEGFWSALLGSLILSLFAIGLDKK